jgi:FixJ family two-component response regulator
VFVVDDEETVRSALARLLRAIGFAAEPFESAEAFLSAYPHGAPGCLLLDIRMPGMSGLDLLDELKRRRIELPAIVMTGHVDDEAMQRLAAREHIAFLEKPFTLEQLKAALTNWTAAPPSTPE